MVDRQEAIRSRRPAGIAQALWGIALAHNLLRLEMVRIAEEVGGSLNRISFVMILCLMRDEWLRCAVAQPVAIPRHLRELRAEVMRLVLPPWRSHRRYPRAVKIKTISYTLKRRVVK